MSTGKKKGLGRGLSALFGDEKPQTKPQEITQSNTISISDLSRNPYQPRQNFREEKLDELCEECKKKDESVIHNFVLTGFKICKSCRVSKTIFPI